MKQVKLFLVMFSLAVMSGCKEECSFEDEVKNRIEEDVKNICADVNSTNLSGNLSRLISSSTNNALRIVLFTMWGDEILAAKLPMQTNDYLSLRRIIDRVEDRILHEISSGLEVACKGAKEDLFDMRFKLIDWQKKCLDELLAVSKNIDKDEYQCMKWRECYTALFYSYRANLNRLECWWYPYGLEFRRTPMDEMDRVREKIERFLGRKIRTPEESRANRDWETETYKKVKRRELP